MEHGGAGHMEMEKMDLTACLAGTGVLECRIAVCLAPWTGFWYGKLSLANHFLSFCAVTVFVIVFAFLFSMFSLNSRIN